MFYLSRKSKKKESCNTRLFVKNNIIDVFQIMLEVKKETELKHVLKALQKYSTHCKKFSTLCKKYSTHCKKFSTHCKKYLTYCNHTTREVLIFYVKLKCTVWHS